MNAEQGDKAPWQHIVNCLQVLAIHLDEDPAPLGDQLEDFFKALYSIGAEKVDSWMRLLVCQLFVVHGLLWRRDARAGKSDLQDILTYAYDAGSPDRVKTAPRSTGLIACLEDQTKDLKAAQTMARLYINATGNTSWEAIAEACDEAFKAGKYNNDTEGVVLALAYPKYGNSLEVEVEEEDDNQRETQQTEVRK